MTSVEISTQSTPSEHIGRRTESRMGTDVLQEQLEQFQSDFMPIQLDTVIDHQIWNVYDEDGQTSTRDARIGAAHHTYLTNPNTSSMDERGYLMHDIAPKQQHFGIEAIDHMNEKEIINELTTRGFADFAERLKYLYDVTGEDEEDIRLDSLRGFATLVIKNRGMYQPQIMVTADGLIQAVWKHPQQGTLVMDFQESGDVAFTLLYGRWNQRTKRCKLIGELPSDQVMRHVGYFVHKIMGT